jgi:serine O-acetyltransferase
VYSPPQGPVDRIYNALILGQKRPFLGRVIRQLLKARGVDIPAHTLQPGTGLFVRHAGNVVVHSSTVIAKNVMLHQGVTVGRSDIWQEPDPSFKGFVLEDHVILGANAVVTSKSGTLVVAEGTVVGANSVLTKSTGPWEIWAGVPAKKIGMRQRP